MAKYKKFFILDFKAIMILSLCNKKKIFGGIMSENEKIKIFIADNSDETTTDIIEHFKTNNKFEIVGTSKDGKEAISKIESTPVDVLITDIVLSGTDGFVLLETLKEKLGNKMPKVIVTSSLSHEGFINKALSLGASYFMIKPYEMQNLESRIMDILGLKVNNQEKVLQKDFKTMRTKIVEEKISNVFITVGIPAHIKGYQFLREAIKMAIDTPDIINSITKRLYPSIAEKFETSASKVERAIRHAIEVAWNRGKIENINSLFGLKVYNQNEKPTNGEFIALVADKMLMEGLGS